MLKFIEVKDAGDVVKFLSDKGYKEQYFNMKIFKDYKNVRKLTFDSKMISVAEIQSNKICKLFSILTPLSGVGMSADLIAFYDDEDFINESISLISDLIQDECVKIKVDLSNSGREFTTVLKKCGFVSEIDVEKPISVRICSYFLA